MILYHFFFKIYIFYTRIFEKFSFIKERVTDSIKTIGILLKEMKNFHNLFHIKHIYILNIDIILK